MTFTDDLESKIRTAYLATIKKKFQIVINGKTLNCNSFRKITEEIKSVMGDGQNKGLSVFEIANNIIFHILTAKYFLYENHQMAILIGYIYLKRQGVTIKKYSINGINDASTLDDIRNLTASW